MSAETTVESTITTLSEQAITYSEAVPGYADSAVTAASGYARSGATVTVTADQITIPVLNDPFADFSAELRGHYGELFNTLPGWLEDQMGGWITQYFPVIDPCIAENVDDWICTTIESGGTGIPYNVESAIWERARSRDVLEAARMEEEAASQFAARGFSMPPGALANRMLRVQQDAANKSSTISRDTAIKNIEVEIENIRFAIEQGIRLRLGVSQGLADYMRAFMLIPQTAVDYANGLAQAKKQLWDAAGSYYNALIGAEELQVRAQIANQNANVTLQQADIAAYGHKVQAQVQAAISAADAMARVASSALSSLNTMASITNNTNA